MEHVCGVLSGEKLVITSLTTERELGWILPCEVFKSRPVLLGIHCDNVEDMCISESIKMSPYFEAARVLLSIWMRTTPPCQRGSCFGQWLISVTDEFGNLLNEAGEIIFRSLDELRCENDRE